MKKESVVLIGIVAFLGGFVTGATVAILKGRNRVDSPVAGPVSPGSENPSTMIRPGPSPAEVAGRIQILKDVVEKDPKNLSAWMELGNLYFDSDQPQKAIEAYSQYLRIKPNNPDVRTDMGIMYRRLGDPDRAIREFRLAAQSDPAHGNSRYNLGIVLLHDKQDIPGAIKAWEEYLKVDPSSKRAERVKTQMARLREMVK